jgi:hypothetical protein
MLDRNRIEGILSKKGCYQLGSGMYGRVHVSTDPTKVVKIGKLHDTWPEYIVWACKEGYMGNIAPMVYSLKEHKDCYVAVMERLETLPGELVDAYRVIEQIGLASCVLPSPYDTFAKALYEFRRANHFYSDLGPKNVMVRKSGELVVTDPIYSGVRTSALRLTEKHTVRAPLPTLQTLIAAITPNATLPT